MLSPALSRAVLCSALALVAASVALWGWSVIRTPLHSDIIWLMEGLGRWLSGYSMSDFIFEPNPPFSLFGYALPYFISSVTGAPAYVTVFGYVMGLLAFWSFILLYGLRRVVGITSEYALLIVCAFILALTVMTTSVYGEREHLIAMALMPMALIQIALTRRMDMNGKLVWLVCALGSFFILLKPHHGLIPFLLILHRMMTQRSVRAMKDPDALCLTFSSLLYVVLTFSLFLDYIQVILPEVFSLYLTADHHDVARQVVLLGLPCVVVIVGGIIRWRVDELRWAGLMGSGALLCLIPFLVQKKGFFYHLLPFFSFLLPACALLLASFLKKELKFPLSWAASCSLILVTAATLYIFRPNFALPSHDDYASLPLTREIEQACGEHKKISGCRFLMFSDSMGVIHETSVETGFMHASRFPSFWFLPTLLEWEKDRPQDSLRARKMYGDRVAADLDTWRPQILLIARIDLNGQGPLDFAAFWAVSPSFRAAWEQYHHQKTIDFSYADYYPGTLIARDPPLVMDVYYRDQ